MCRAFGVHFFGPLCIYYTYVCRGGVILRSLGFTLLRSHPSLLSPILVLKSDMHCYLEGQLLALKIRPKHLRAL